MNPVVLAFASGDSLYFGAALLLLVIVASPYLKQPWALRCRNIAAWLGVAMMVMACPPFSWVVDAIFVGAFALWFIGSNWFAAGPVGRRSRAIVASPLALLLVTLSAVELPHRTMPKLQGEVSDHLVVIGDSISSGIGTQAPAWPVVMQQETGVPVKNLALPGAQMTEAQGMVKGITPDDRVVLLEIGGNDMLSGVPGSEFGKSLDVLLSKVKAPSRTVVMFELPLLPDKIAYGQSQRRLAAKYGVWLIPKRFFVEVLGGANATSDGLHLSTTGARRMASLVAQALAPVLQPSAPGWKPHASPREQ